MTIQTTTASTNTHLQIQNNQFALSTVKIDADEDLTNAVAQQIFSTYYAKLFEIKNARAIELSDLTAQKHSLEKSWAYYLRSPEEACPSFYTICVINTAVSSCVGFGWIISKLISNSLTPNQFGIGAGFLGNAIFTTTTAIACGEIVFPCLPCVSSVLKSYDKVLNKISNIQKQKREISQLIKLTNVFANFCQKWPQIIPEIENADQIKAFKLLKDLLNEYDADIVKIAGEKFLHLAPLFLMEKVCSLYPIGELATSWKHIKTSPQLWKNNDLWKKVQLENPSGTDYIDFFETVDKNSVADPSKWGEWFKKKLELYIEKSEI